MQFIGLRTEYWWLTSNPQCCDVGSWLLLNSWVLVVKMFNNSEKLLKPERHQWGALPSPEPSSKENPLHEWMLKRRSLFICIIIILRIFFNVCCLNFIVTMNSLVVGTQKPWVLLKCLQDWPKQNGIQWNVVFVQYRIYSVISLITRLRGRKERHYKGFFCTFLCILGFQVVIRHFLLFTK